MGNAMMEQNQMGFQVEPNPSLGSESLGRGSNGDIQDEEDAREANIMKLFNSDNEKLNEKMKKDSSRIPVGWKGWEDRSYLYNLRKQRQRRWNPMANHSKNMKNWSLNKTLNLLPNIPMNIKIPSKRFRLGPRLSKLYKWKLVQKLPKLGEEKYIKQINDNNSDFQTYRDMLRIPYKRTFQDSVLRFG